MVPLEPAPHPLQEPKVLPEVPAAVSVTLPLPSLSLKFAWQVPDVLPLETVQLMSPPGMPDEVTWPDPVPARGHPRARIPPAGRGRDPAGRVVQGWVSGEEG